MKYRVAGDDFDETLTIITEDGGLATLEDRPGEFDTSIEYFHKAFTDEMLKHPDEFWDTMAEGQISYKDTLVHFRDEQQIQETLAWLAVDEEFELDESIWPNFIY